MNRKQRRSIHKTVPRDNRLHVVPPEKAPDFSSVPLATICQSINLLVDELRGRGIKAYDFDCKDRELFGVQIIRGQVYFIAAKEGDNDEKV